MVRRAFLFLKENKFMMNNDVLRRVRYALDLNDATMMDIFALSDYEITREELLKFLKKDNEDDFSPLNNKKLSLFLDGLITYRRGKKEESTMPIAKKKESELDNNGILRKLRIAFEFKEDDMLNTLDLAGFRLSKPELSAFFRHEDHKHHRKCGDQVLRNFLQGLIIHLRPSEKDE
jgi:uncharacterized protein YehS (DUF1456 family)